MAVVQQAEIGFDDRLFFKQLARLEGWEKLTFFAFLLPALVLLCSLFIYPLITFLLTSFFDPSFTLKYYAKALTRPVYLRILKATIEISGLTTLGTLLLGYPVAYLFANVSPKVRMLLVPFVLLPFWTSVLVRMFAWMALLGSHGVFNNMLQGLGIISSPLPMLFNRFAVLVGMIHFMLPYMILPTYSVMSGIPNELMQAANNLGAGPYRSFLRVYLPLSLPGAGAGCLLVFIISLAFYVTPALLGGIRETMIAQIIEQQISEFFTWQFAAALSAILLAMTIALYLIYTRILGAERIYEGKTK